MSQRQFWFRSTLFEIEPGEDEETNPSCYGRQLSRWLRDRLISEGQIVEDPIPEDWGWCLVVQRRPHLLWVGCSCIGDFPAKPSSDAVPLGSEVVWSCMVVAEQSLLGWFRGNNTAASVEALLRQVKNIIGRESSNSFVSEP